MNNSTGRDDFREGGSYHQMDRGSRRHANTTSSSESSSPHLDESQEEALKADLSRRHANTTSSSESSSPHLDESQEEALKADLSRRHANKTSCSESSSPHLDESQEEALKADLSRAIHLSLHEQDLVPLAFWHDSSSRSVGVSSTRLDPLAQQECKQSLYFEPFQNGLGSSAIPEIGDPRGLHRNALPEVDPELQKLLSSFEEPSSQYRGHDPCIGQYRQQGKQEKEDVIDTKVFRPYPRTRRSHAAAFPQAITHRLDSDPMEELSSLSTFQNPDISVSACFVGSIDNPPTKASSMNDSAQGSGRVSQTSVEEEDATKAPSSTETSADVRFRDYQEDQWLENFAELQEFIKTTGRAFIPQDYPGKDSLARWAKRQRYQYTLRNEGKVSTLTDERVERLDSVGFVWSSHLTTFEERLDELRMFKREMGHCNVPSQYPPNQKLSTWVKCQRRQYKLLMEGRKSNMTDERIQSLNKHGFVWEIRKHPPRKK